MVKAIVAAAIWGAALLPAACQPNLGAGPAVVQCEYGTQCPDVTPPARLDITNVPTIAECDAMGGVYTGTTCVGVDY